MPRYTDLPQHRGERKVAEQFETMFPDAHFWYDVKGLHRVRNLDVIMLHKEVGLWVVEVKAIKLSMLKDFSRETCKIDYNGDGGWKQADNPVVQANEGAKRMMDAVCWESRPFAVATACWPSISRYEWNSQYRNSPYAGDYAERMLFREDIEATAAVLMRRLETIRKTPPVGEPPRLSFQYRASYLEDLKRTINTAVSPQPTTPDDLTRLRALEKEARGEIVALVPPGSSTRLVLEGYPSTGKTFKLIAIAAAHVGEGMRVLLLSFNKVLVADLERLVKFRMESELPLGDIEIEHIDGLLAKRSAIYGRERPESESDWEAWKQMIVADLRERPCERPFDTVLIDEAQDLKQWALEFAEWLCKPSGTMVVAVGKGQSIYGGQASWLGEFRRTATRRELRRVFRNTKATFALAHAVFEGGTSLQDVGRSMRKVLAQSVEGLNFEREDPVFPRIRWVDDRALQEMAVDDPRYARAQEDLMVEAYTAIIEDELESLGEQRWPLHLLVLVPDNESSRECGWARSALRSIAQRHDDVTVLDYCSEMNRTVAPRSSDIRLCTVHSSRGIEASRVVVLGLERLASRARAGENEQEFRSLGFVALSRAKRDVAVVLPARGRAWPIARALEVALDCLNLPSSPAFADSVNEDGRPRFGQVPVVGASIPPHDPDTQTEAELELKQARERERNARIARYEAAARGIAGPLPKIGVQRRPGAGSSASAVVRSAVPVLPSVPVSQANEHASVVGFEKGAQVRHPVHGTGTVRKIVHKAGYQLVTVKFPNQRVDLRVPGEPLMLV